MMPSWVKAPEWANYRAMDADGRWVWFANEPIAYRDFWGPNFGQYELSSRNYRAWRFDWKSTVSKRPESVA